MGCCCRKCRRSAKSLSAMSWLGHWNDPEGYDNTELNPVPVPWLFGESVTKDEISKIRHEFWTSVLIGGKRRERKVYLKIKKAADHFFNGEVEKAQEIIKKSHLRIPLGDLSVVFGEKNVAYFIPLYCMSFPDDVVESCPVTQNGSEIRAQDIVLSCSIHSTKSKKPID